MTHVGIITSSYPRFDGDWAGNFVRDQARALAAQGMRVTVVAPQGEVARTLSDPGVQVAEARHGGAVFYGAGAPEQMARDPARFLAAAPSGMAELLGTAQEALACCDVLIGHWLFPGGLAVASLARGRPWALVLHSTASRWYLRMPGWLRSEIAECVRSAAMVSCPDPQLAGRMASRLGRSVHWIPPFDRGRRLAPLARAIPSMPGGERPLRVGFLGRKVAVKGLDVLQAATAQSRGLDIHIAGPGDWGHPSEWHDHGPLTSDHDVAGFLAHMDVMVLPSQSNARRAEGLPVTLLESWACGTPVVASRSGACEILLPRAWTFEAGDANGLEERLHTLVEAPSELQEERRRCVTHYARLERCRAQGHQALVHALGLERVPKVHVQPTDGLTSLAIQDQPVVKHDGRQGVAE